MYQEVLASLFPWINTRRPTVKVTVSDRVNINHSWEGGSRSDHAPVNPENGTPVPMPELENRYAVTHFDTRKSGGYAPTSPGVAFLARSTFQGKVMPPLLILCQADFDRLVTTRLTCTVCEECRANSEIGRACFAAGSRTLSPLHAKILEVYGIYKSSYRKEEIARIGGTDEDIESLLRAGFLSRNRAGATTLTASGRIEASKVRS